MTAEEYNNKIGSVMGDLSDIRSLADMIKESAGKSIDALDSLRADSGTVYLPLSAVLSAKVLADNISHALWMAKKDIQKFAAALEFLQSNTPQRV